MVTKQYLMQLWREIEQVDAQPLWQDLYGATHGITIKGAPYVSRSKRLLSAQNEFARQAILNPEVCAQLLIDPALNPRTISEMFSNIVSAAGTLGARQIKEWVSQLWIIRSRFERLTTMYATLVELAKRYNIEDSET